MATKAKKSFRNKGEKRRKSLGDDPSDECEVGFVDNGAGSSKPRFGQLEISYPKTKRVRFAEDEVDHAYVTSEENNRINEEREKASFKDKITKKSSLIPSRKAKKIETSLSSLGESWSLEELKKSPFVSTLEIPRIRKPVVSIPLKKEQEEDAKSTRSFNIPSSLVDSREQARRCFQWLINPYDSDQFMRHNWEKEPLLLKRKKPSYYSGVFSTQDFDRILRERSLQYGKNIDITSFINEERKTFNPDGRAYPAVVWDHYLNGCSVRLLNPQTYSRSVWKLNSILQEFFGCFVGANIYLTPPGTQGFAPHYDDIEAFVLQLEGKKIWKVYAPLDDKNTLPRFSSKNFCHGELTSPPLITVELEPGDLLYFPRGFIHEAKAVNDEHSLHITISAAQKNTYGDLLEILLPHALNEAIQNNQEFRESLPNNHLQYMGMVHRNEVHADRETFKEKLISMVEKLTEYIDADFGVDEMAKNFIQHSLPPVLTIQEKDSSIHGAGEHWSSECQTVEGGIEISLDTQIRLIRYGVVRLAKDEEIVRLYHSLENSYDPHHEVELQYITIETSMVSGVEHLIKSYPNYVAVSELPMANGEDKVEIANLLFDKGIVTVLDESEIE